MSDMIDEPQGEDRDRTKLVWGGIFGAFVLMIVALALMDRPDPNSTMIHTRHILIKYPEGNPVERQRALRTIGELRERILNGESFSKLAEEYSDDPGSRLNGGDLGYRDPIDFEPAYQEYALKGEIGQISEVISTDHGFHIIEVLDRRLSDWDAREKLLEEKIREEKEPESDSPAL